MSDFSEALALVLTMEGGKVDDPRDPGGRTNHGVTQRTFDAWLHHQGRHSRSVFSITPAEVESIYHDDFARPLCFDRLPRGLGYAVLDAGVNSGPVRAVRWLQAAAGLRTTGHLDLATLAAASTGAPRMLIDRLCDLRLGMLRHLPAWGHFGRGWSRRVAFVRAHAHAMTAHPPAAR